MHTTITLKDEYISWSRLHHLPRDDPVGQVAVRGHLHGTQDGHIHLGAPDHPEGLRGGEQGATSDHRHRLLNALYMPKASKSHAMESAPCRR